MTQVTFAKAFRRHVDCPDGSFDFGRAASLREVLAAYFDEQPAVRSYVVDERGAVRKHVAVFINDDLITDRDQQSDPVAAGDTVSVFQALSGGAV